MSLLGLSFVLDESLRLLKDMVDDFAKKEIAPLAKEIDETNAFPRHLWPKMGALGLLGITVAEADGGSGMGYLAHVLAMESISRASGSVGLSYGAHSNLCVNQIFLNATDAQKKKYLPKLMSGEHVGALAMSEAGAGSDVMHMQCEAKKHGDHYVLNGTKMWCTNGPDADVLVVYARTTKDAGSKGISAFIIEKDFAGFHSAQKLDKLGMRGSSTSELVFQNCKIPAENLLGKENNGSHVLMRGLNYERLVLAAGPLGIMQACMDIALPYCHERKQFGKYIGEFQLMEGKLADMYTTVCASRAFLYSTAQACDTGSLPNRDAAAVILYTAENATQIALQALQVLGGNGYINEYATGRLLRDAKLYEIGAGTSEIRRMLIGRELFKAFE